MLHEDWPDDGILRASSSPFFWGGGDHRTTSCALVQLARLQAVCASPDQLPDTPPSALSTCPRSPRQPPAAYTTCCPQGLRTRAHVSSKWQQSFLRKPSYSRPSIRVRAHRRRKISSSSPESPIAQENAASAPFSKHSERISGPQLHFAKGIA